MAEKTTWIKIDRNILEWRWFKDCNTLQVFLWLLLNANIKRAGFMGVEINRGEIATSYSSIAAHTGLTVNQARTAISHLKSTGEITSRKYAKFSVFSIVNYASYQDTITGKSTVKSQADHRQGTGRPQQSKNGRKKERKNIYTRTREGERDSDTADVAEIDRSWEDELNVPISLRGEFGCKEDYVAFYERNA